MSLDREVLVFFGAPVLAAAAWFVWVARRKQMSGGETALGLILLGGGSVVAGLAVFVFPLLLLFTVGYLGRTGALLLCAIAAWPLFLTIRWERRPKKSPLEGARKLALHWIAAAVVGGTVFLVLVSYSYGPGPFERSPMEAIVTRVRQKNLQPGSEHSFKDSGHRVWAECSATGKLRVVIETVDGGKGVHFGFAYCDDGQMQSRSGSLDLPGPINQVTKEGKIDDHWWRVESWE